MSLLQLDSRIVLNRDAIQSPNLCDRFKERDRERISEAVWLGYDRDLMSRAKWAKRMEAAMDLAMQIQTAKNWPWPGCSNVIFPLITISALQFSARSYSNLIQGNNIVQYRVIGEDPSGDMVEIAKRISRHMSWQVLEEDKAWEEEHDRLFINLAVVGTAFIKSYFNAKQGYNSNELVMARDLVINYWAKSVEQAARKTHIVPLYRNDIYERVMQETFVDVLDSAWFNSVPGNYQPSSPGSPQQKQDNRQGQMAAEADEDTPFKTLEQHRFLDLDGDGYAEPYIATIEENSRTLLRLVARIDDEAQIERNVARRVIQITPTEFFTKYSFIPAIDGGIYDIGFGTLLGPLNESVNTAINQLLDAGTMSNSTGGFLGRGAKIMGGNYTMAPWEWKRVDSTGDDLKKSLVPLPVREPSLVLFQLLNLLVSYSDRLSGTTDQMVGITPGQNTPAETSRNALEQGMQVYSTIFKRVWRSMKEEFKKNHKLNGIYLQSQKRFGPGGDLIRREDYKTNPDLVAPSADPTVSSMSMRFFKAQSLRQAAMTMPGYNIPVVERRFLEAMQVEGIDQVYPGPDKIPPPPNPQAEAEQMKWKVKALELKNAREQFMAELMETKRLNNAKILQLQAQALKLANDAQDAKAELRLETVHAHLEALRVQNESIDTRINAVQALKGMQDEDEGTSSPGSSEPVAGGSSDSGSSGSSGEMAGDTE